MSAPSLNASIDAEEHVLGALLISQRALEAVSFLDPDDFYRTDYGQIYRHALSLHLTGTPVDTVTLAGALPEHKDTIMLLAAIVPAASNAAHHAKIVKAHAEQRRFIRSLDEAATAVESGDLKLAEEILAELSSKPSAGLTIVSMANALVDLEEEVRNPPDLIGIDAPFSFLKPYVGGRVYIYAGYQGEGKTALMGQVVQHVATKKTKVGCFTLEMTWRDLRDRFVAAQGVPYDQLQERRFNDQYAQRAYEDALAKMALWQVELIDKPDLTVADIKRVQKLQNYDMLVIDHLHRFDWRDRRDLERITAAIVNIAKEFNVPILLLAQLKRPFGTDKLPRPTMSMLRESGMIEAEAAMVAFVYRPRNDVGLRGMDSEFVVAKNRYGDEGLYKLLFLGEQQRFIEPI